MRSPEGGYSERHLPICEARPTSSPRGTATRSTTQPAETDANGVKARQLGLMQLRSRLSKLLVR